VSRALPDADRDPSVLPRVPQPVRSPPAGSAQCPRIAPTPMASVKRKGDRPFGPPGMRAEDDASHVGPHPVSGRARSSASWVPIPPASAAIGRPGEPNVFETAPWGIRFAAHWSVFPCLSNGAGLGYAPATAVRGHRDASIRWASGPVSGRCSDDRGGVYYAAEALSGDAFPVESWCGSQSTRCRLTLPPVSILFRSEALRRPSPRIAGRGVDPAGPGAHQPRTRPPSNNP
jgi:hypothetical protein